MIPEALSFDAPERLWLLVAVGALLVAYVVLQLRRASYERRLVDADLAGSVLPRRPGWRRHLSASLMVLTMAALTAGFARPSADVQVPRENATVVIALDTSGSMQATDVSPTRLDAAKAAAEDFVQGLPDTFAVGLVSFSSSAVVAAAPTQDHAAVVTAIQSLQLGGATAIGDAVSASVQSAAALAAAASTATSKEAAPVHIVLLSDGSNTAGSSIAAGVSEANASGYPVSTIAYGTQDGVVVQGGREIRVPVDSAALAALAEDTGGTPYEAASGTELEDVYDDIAEDVGTRTVREDITGRLAALSALLAFGAAAGSLLTTRVLT